MRRLLNTLYITSEDVYLALDGENALVKRENEIIARFPLHTVESIVSFSYAGASPALMGACAQKGIGLCFLTPRGRFLARSVGEAHGNVLLRRRQYRAADDEAECVRIASSMLIGKLYNCRQNLERCIRDHGLRVDGQRLSAASASLKETLPQLRSASTLDMLRGLEGDGARTYFGVFDELILREKENFRFESRNRRPPTDRINALLSFAYMLLSGSCAHALESVGLDSYVGFLHRDRPGRTSLALDLMEELRPYLADRFVLTLINNRTVCGDDFKVHESGAVSIDDDARKNILKAWQERKRDEIVHPYLGEKLPLGLLPFVQAQLLARYLRGDLDEYPPFLMK
ncbi:MAG: type I-C CRISPR-associated endonuclease Cas1 [Clostridia bacterium]|nr:type I-C CRISPR-associated endonuclease Cas1 [Clostridia bacterium]